IVILSSSAMASTWVHQEVAIAQVQDIPVWPICVEDGVRIEGVIFGTEGFYFARHSSPYGQIEQLAEEIKNTMPRAGVSGRSKIDEYIVTKVARTRRLIEMLRKEAEAAGLEYVWRLQAAFSSFSISEEREYVVEGYHTPMYHDLLVQEMRAAEVMARKCRVKAILWPRRAFEGGYRQHQRARFRALIQWLERGHDVDRVKVVLGPYDGSNRYIFDGNALVEGFKAPDSDTRGYQLTTVTHHGPAILAAIKDFDALFDAFWDERARAGGASSDEEAIVVRASVIDELKRLESEI
ncbi:MAG TPA: hypothetical protein VEZ11_03060, partial [Thermoanaerobaculia bacterium]|nr:hypothetical protein [Thermoanaerobaculia bacterium]